MDTIRCCCCVKFTTYAIQTTSKRNEMANSLVFITLQRQQLVITKNYTNLAHKFRIGDIPCRKWAYKLNDYLKSKSEDQEHAYLDDEVKLNKIRKYTHQIEEDKFQKETNTQKEINKILYFSWRLGGGWYPMCTLFYLYRGLIYGLICTQPKNPSQNWPVSGDTRYF